MPVLFRETISNTSLCDVDQWWSGLEPLAREQVLRFWEACSLDSGPEETNETSGVGVRVEGEFVDGEEGQGFWDPAFYDYLVNHEIFLSEKPRFHICTRHPVARQAIQRGLIPADFQCPFGDSECQMRKVLGLSPGKSLRLRLAFYRKPELTGPIPKPLPALCSGTFWKHDG